jgi:1-acyl-sn-glycerol-3-phosphate acyltransferase
MIYFMFIFILILAILVYLFYILFIIISPKKYIPILNKYFSKYFIKICRFKSLNILNIDNFNKIKKKDFIIVANHISLYDGIILTAIFGNVCFLADKNGLGIPGSDFVHKKLGSVIINKDNKGNSDKIKEYILKNNDNILVIFPDGMDPIEPNKNIANFKTGAFKDGLDVLPVIIKYKNFKINPTFYWYKGENTIHGFIKMLLDGNCDIHVKILNLQNKKNYEDIDNYRKRIYNLMSNEYNNF